jgi:hypothetical protein
VKNMNNLVRPWQELHSFKVFHSISDYYAVLKVLCKYYLYPKI